MRLNCSRIVGSWAVLALLMGCVPDIVPRTKDTSESGGAGGRQTSGGASSQPERGSGSSSGSSGFPGGGGLASAGGMGASASSGGAPEGPADSGGTSGSGGDLSSGSPGGGGSPTGGSGGTGTGGSATTSGGATAAGTGGRASGGTAGTGTGGNSTGGNSTGGSSTGSSSTGGSGGAGGVVDCGEITVPTPSSKLTALDVDAEGNVWFTENSGQKIGKFNPRTQAFKEYPAAISPYGLRFNPTDGQIYVWGGTYGAGLFGTLNPATEALTTFPSGKPVSSASDGLVRLDGSFWFNGWDSQSVSLGTPAGKVTHFLPPNFGYTSGLTEDANGNLWLTLVDGGEGNPRLLKLATASAVPNASSGFTEIPLYAAASTVRGPRASGSRIWFMVQDRSAIAYYDVLKATVTTLATTTANAGVAGLEVDAFGNPWFAEPSANRIGFYDGGAGTFRDFPITTANAGPFALALDAKGGRVWFTEQTANSLGCMPLVQGAPEAPVYVAAESSHSVIPIDSEKSLALPPISIPGPHVRGMDFTPDGRRLYVTTEDTTGSNDIVVVDTDPKSPTFHKVLTTLSIDSAPGAATPVTGATGIFVDPSGKRAFVRVDNGYLAVLDTDPCSSTYHHLGPAIVTGVGIHCAFTPVSVAKELWCNQDGPWGTPSAVAIFNTDPSSAAFATATQLSLPDRFSPQGISISPDGSKAYVSSWGSALVRVFDRATHGSLGDMSGGGGTSLRGNALSPDGKRLYAVTDGTTTVRAYDASTRALLGSVQLDTTGDSGHLISLSLDGRKAYVSGANVNYLRIIDVTGATPVQSTTVAVPGGPGWISVRPPIGATAVCR